MLRIRNRKSIPRPLLASLVQVQSVPLIHQRGVALFVARVIKSVLKLRYLVLGGAAAGGVSLHQVKTIRNALILIVT